MKKIELLAPAGDVYKRQPKSCVAVGTGKALNELDSLKTNYLNKKEPYL